MTRSVGRTTLLAAVFAAGASWLAEPLTAKTAAEEAAEISGIDTPEATSLDGEADRLLEQSQKAEAEANALLARARGKIDPDVMRERLQRGDPSVLFEASPEEKQAREREAQARALKDQAYAKARDAADKRARAAVEQRCKPSPATQGNPLSDPSSSFLSSAVRGGGAKTGSNDPWEVCSSAEQYLEGLQSEIAGIQARAQGFVGRSWWGDAIESERVERDFGHRSLAQLIAMPPGGIKKAFEEAAAAIQRELARGRLDGKLGARGNKNNDRDFDLAVHGAYALVHKAVAAAWQLHREESSYSSVILSTEIAQHQKSLFDIYVELRNAIWDSVAGDGKEWNHAALVAYLAALKPLAKSHDQADFRYIEETIQKTRSIAGNLQDARKRLSSDMGHWVSFAAKDGTNLVGSQGEIFGAAQGGSVQELKFEIQSSRLGYYGGIPWYREWEGEQNDAAWRIWADMPKDFRRQYPELSWDFETWNQGGQVNLMALIYPLGNTEKRVAEAVVSGAHPSQRP